MAFLLHIQPQIPASIVLLVLGNSSSHRVPLKHEEGLRCISSPKDFTYRSIPLLDTVTPLTIVIHATKAC